MTGPYLPYALTLCKMFYDDLTQWCIAQTIELSFQFVFDGIYDLP